MAFEPLEQFLGAVDLAVGVADVVVLLGIDDEPGVDATFLQTDVELLGLGGATAPVLAAAGVGFDDRHLRDGVALAPPLDLPGRVAVT